MREKRERVQKETEEKEVAYPPPSPQTPLLTDSRTAPWQHDRTDSAPTRAPALRRVAAAETLSWLPFRAFHLTVPLGQGASGGQTTKSVSPRSSRRSGRRRWKKLTQQRGKTRQRRA